MKKMLTLVLVAVLIGTFAIGEELSEGASLECEEILENDFENSDPAPCGGGSGGGPGGAPG